MNPEKYKRLIKPTIYGGIIAAALMIYGAIPERPPISGIVKSEDFRLGSVLYHDEYTFSVSVEGQLVNFRSSYGKNNPRKLDDLLTRGDSVDIRSGLRKRSGRYLVEVKDILSLNGKKLQ